MSEVNDANANDLHSRKITRNGLPDTEKRGPVSAKFRQPPPVIDINLGYRPQAITIADAEKLVADLQAALQQTSKNLEVIRKAES